MGKLKAFLKSAWGALCAFLLGCLLMSWFASLINTSGYSVKVTNTTVDMDALYEKTYGTSQKKPFRLTIGDNHDGMVNAKLNMNIYLPKGVSSSNPAPAICLTHGYLNSKEFEEAPAIELSRRGYVVFEYDQYDHGDSTWDTPGGFQFYAWSAYDAMEYAYAQDYVLKDSSGNGMIAVSGHSMGGFGSELAVGWDEINNLMGVYTQRKVNVLLAAGADFRYDDFYIKAYSGGYFTHTYDTYANRSCATLAAQYDEFFFDNTKSDDDSGKTVTKKDFAKDPVGYAMLGLTSAGEDNTFYKVSDYERGAKNVTFTGVKEDGKETLSDTYGERIIYMVAGDHPYNTWSPEATAHMVDFYNHAFAHQLAMHGLSDYSTKVASYASGSHQIWWWKEVFTCLGLFSLIGAVIALVSGLIRLPVFRKAKSLPEGEEETASEGGDPRSLNPTPADASAAPEKKKPSIVLKAFSIFVSIFSILVSAFMIPYLLGMSGTGVEFAYGFGKYLFRICTVLVLAGLIAVFVLRVTKGEDWIKERRKELLALLGSLGIVALLSLLLCWISTSGNFNKIFNGTNTYWNAPSQKGILYWALVSSLVTLLIVLLKKIFLDSDKSLDSLGLKAKWKNVGSSLLVAIVGGLLVYLVTLFSTKVFLTDFRVYTYAIRLMNGNQFVAGLRYLPFYFLFVLMVAIAIEGSTKNVKGLKGDFLAAGLEVLPMCLFLLYQYGTLLATGTAAYPTSALDSILVQGFFFTLAFLGFLQHHTTEKTGNIWTGVFLNSLLITLITLANTTVYNLH